jgi:hypothetical protein
MSVDTILALLGLAVAVAALVPIFTAKGIKGRVVEVACLVFLAGLCVVFIWGQYRTVRERDHLRDDMMRMLSSNNPMTFEQIYSALNFPDYASAEQAIDELVYSHQIHNAQVEVTSAAGKKYVVRVYNNINFPVE